MSESEATAMMPRQDERIMAALAHATVILPLWGVIAPIIIWTTQREKSHYAASQAFQALGYQLSLILIWFAGMACYLCSFFGMFAGMLAVPVASPPGEMSALVVLPMFLPFLVLGIILLVWLALVAYGLVGAVQALRGKTFRYVIIGTRLERYLNE